MHLRVSPLGRVQNKEEMKSILFVELGAGAVEDGARWERWELDAIMRGLTRVYNKDQDLGGNALCLWLEKTVLGPEIDPPATRHQEVAQLRKAVLAKEMGQDPRPVEPEVYAKEVLGWDDEKRFWWEW